MSHKVETAKYRKVEEVLNKLVPADIAVAINLPSVLVKLCFLVFKNVTK